MNEYFEQIYLINLVRRKDKLIRVLYGLDLYKIKVNVIEAVDGHHPNVYTSRMNTGAYGYLLSWKKGVI